MGFFDDLKSVLNDDDCTSETTCTTTCWKCKKFCKHTQKGIKWNLQPVRGSRLICHNCNAVSRYNGNNWEIDD